MLTPAQLRCEYAENPLALDSPEPRLSWQLNAERRGSRQAAYQVQAASSHEGLVSGEPDLWDTGMLSSVEQMVEYGGRELSGGESCWWRVRAWDQDGTPGEYSPAAWFEMGLAPQDWRAEWIGCPGTWINRAITFRNDFTLEKPVRRARVYMAGLGWSELYVNGQRANDRVLAHRLERYTPGVEEMWEISRSIYQTLNRWHREPASLPMDLEPNELAAINSILNE
ncbi:MAG: alpha-L-rhamnosidase N-terminal domain-containing protein [Saprospiraceae bacterium]|nr:alpha-L-rhamnosidase N-terminal domain-containing protein [Saprospiraceae bacterium]